jgi:DNA-binding transcriptional LysR family regulator
VRYDITSLDLFIAIAQERNLTRAARIKHLASSTHALLTHEAKKTGMVLKLRIRISRFDCMCRMISTGLGLAVLPRNVINQYLRSHKLKAVTLDEPWARRALLLVLKKYDSASPTLN